MGGSEEGGEEGSEGGRGWREGREGWKGLEGGKGGGREGGRWGLRERRHSHCALLLFLVHSVSIALRHAEQGLRSKRVKGGMIEC
eukprot:763522-Rhodomonas_salina.2